MRVPHEDEPLSADMFAEPERSEPDDVRKRRAYPPQVADVSRIERRFELVPGKYRHVIEKAEPRRKHRGQRDRDRELVGCGEFERLVPHLQGARQLAVHALVVEHARGEQDVRGRERRAIREADAAAQRERVRQPIVGRRPALGKRRLDFIGGAIHTNEPRVGEQGDEISGGGCLEVAVIAGWLATERGDELSCGGGGRRCARPPEYAADDQRDESDGDQREADGPGHKLTCRPTSWPVLQTIDSEHVYVRVEATPGGPFVP